MIKRDVDTIIIGGGVAGLGCARKLFNSGEDFSLITENIGGRILTSKDNNVNYGAYYLTRDYKNIKKYVQIGRKLTPLTIHFHKKHHTYSIFNKRLITHFLQLIRLIFLLKKFRKQYEIFKTECENKPQKEVLKNNPFLFKLYNQNAEKLLQEYKIKELVDDYMSEVLHGTTFLPIKKLNGFTFLHFALPLIVSIYEFKFLKHKIIDGFKRKIINDSVISISQVKDNYKVETKNKIYTAKNVVLATPPHISAKLLKFKKIKKPVNAHMFHIDGTLKNNWKECEANLFSDNNRMFAIVHQPNNTYLFYSLGNKPNFNIYFSKYKIIKHHFWNPAFNLLGHELWDCEIKKNLFLIGDHNICGLEDSYITGIYAANKIISNYKKTD